MMACGTRLDAWIEANKDNIEIFFQIIWDPFIICCDIFGLFTFFFRSGVRLLSLGHCLKRRWMERNRSRGVKGKW
jgi:hypothetical protein